MSDRHRVLVIGLDGMSPEAVDRVTARGVMPVVASLCDRGARGILRSTVPPFTCPAWPTMCTGVGPGRHGVFSFVHRPAAGQVRVTTSADLDAPRFWQLAAAAGRRAAVLYVPTMYPADEVTPLFVSGFPTPDRPNIGAVYPPEAEAALRQRIPVFQESNVYMHARPAEGESAEAARLRAIRDGARHEARRVTEAFAFAAREPLDLAMAVFSFPDNAFHGAYGSVTAGDDAPPERLALRDGVDAGLREIDTAVGRLLETFGEPATVLVVSDHGFTHKCGTFYVSECLRQAGLLKPARMRYLLSRFTKRQKSEDARENYVAEDPWTDPNTDWKHTLAFPAHDHELGVFVNLKGRNPEGVVPPEEYDAVVRRVREAVLAVRDPETGEAPVEAVTRRDELYTGPHVGRAPDLLIQPARGWHVRRKLSSRRWGKVPAQRENEGLGIHHPDGILVAAGSAVRRDAAFDRAWIGDVGATVLALQGLATPEPLDGRVLEEVVTFPAHPTVVEAGASGAAKADGQGAYSAEEESEVARRLEELGYL